MDIGESVKVVDLLARQSYREHQLEPFLSKLKEEADNTVTLIGDLNESLKCESLFRSVIILLSVISCVQLHQFVRVFRFYNDALNAACGDGLFGLFVMLVSAVISALFFTILVWCNSHTWIYFKHKAKYVKVNIKARPYVYLQLNS